MPLYIGVQPQQEFITIYHALLVVKVLAITVQGVLNESHAGFLFGMVCTQSPSAIEAI